jgi:hypothetical protein
MRRCWIRTTTERIGVGIRWVFCVGLVFLDSKFGHIGHGAVTQPLRLMFEIIRYFCC